MPRKMKGWGVNVLRKDVDSDPKNSLNDIIKLHYNHNVEV